VKTIILSVALLMLIPATTKTGQAAEPSSDKWQFKITPYLWIATIKGDTGSDGGGIDFDTDYRFFSLDNLDGAFFVAASASKGRWTWQTDLVYLNFNDNIILDPIDISIDLTGTVVELSAGYKLQRFNRTEILFGARQVSLDLDINRTSGQQTSGGQSWLDPIVGLRHIRPLGERWQAIGRLDVGGFGVSSDLTVNVLAGASFRMTRHSSLILGYRYLRLDFADGDILEDLTAKGFALGLEFNF
jgi:opacity protein-like surface antigen